MPKIYEYFGLVVLFFSRAPEPIHVHGRYQDREMKAEIHVDRGEIVEIRIKTVSSKSPLARTPAFWFWTARSFICPRHHTKVGGLLLVRQKYQMQEDQEENQMSLTNSKTRVIREPANENQFDPIDIVRAQYAGEYRNHLWFNDGKDLVVDFQGFFDSASNPMIRKYRDR